LRNQITDDSKHVEDAIKPIRRKTY